MNIVYVDSTKAKVDGYGYLNQDGTTEYITLPTEDGIVEVIVGRADIGLGGESIIYYEDIPKLIKALEAVYNHAKENK